MAEEKGQLRSAEDLDAQAAARRRLALQQIRQYPDPVLRMTARDVESFDDALARLVERMKGLMADANGIGLAGTQVGILQRVFVFRPDSEEDVTAAVVNPVITFRGEEKEVDEEGCLSLQGVLVPVERDLEVHLEGKDELGKDVSWELTGLGARVVQHEVDHLDGKLILDHTDEASRRDALAVLRPRLVG